MDTMHMFYKYRSEGVIKFNGLYRTTDSEVQVVHISHAIIAYTFKSLSSLT